MIKVEYANLGRLGVCVCDEYILVGTTIRESNRLTAAVDGSPELTCKIRRPSGRGLHDPLI